MAAHHLFSVFDLKDYDIVNLHLTEQVNYFNLKVLINHIKIYRL